MAGAWVGRGQPALISDRRLIGHEPTKIALELGCHAGGAMQQFLELRRGQHQGITGERQLFERPLAQALMLGPLGSVIHEQQV
jgi:hypothetical protein